jgi:hypothetical protein
VYAANFLTQYELTTSAVPSLGGTVSPASGGFIDAGASVTVTATAISPFAFNAWTGGASGGASSATISMDAPESVIANFGVPGFSCDPVGNGSASVVDVAQLLHEALGVIPASDYLAGNNFVSVVDVQVVINAATGSGCFAGYR